MNVALMSPVANPSATKPQALLRAWSLFWRCAPLFVRWATLVAFAPFAAIDLWRGHAPVLYLFAMLLWWIWVPRLAVLQRDARAERLPLPTGDVALALSIALLPLLAGFAQRPKPETFAVFVVICAAGIVFSLSSFARLRWLMLALLLWGYGDALCDMLFGMKPMHQGFTAAFDLIGRTAWYPSLAIVMVSAAIWSWRALLREPNDRAGTIMRTPLILLPRAKAENTDTMDAFMTGVSLGLFAGMVKTRVEQTPRTRVQAMRGWIGFPFAPSACPPYVALAFLLFACAGFLVVESRSSIAAWAFDLVALSTLSAIFVLHLTRLLRLMRAPSGELAELALLPGWGDGQAAKRAFSRAILGPLLTYGLTMLMVLALLPLAQWQAQRLSAEMAIALFVVACEVSTATALIAFAIMTGFRLTPAVQVLLALALIAFVAATLLLFAGVGNAFMRGLQLGLLLYLSPLALAIVPILRRYRRRPHPFLSN
ncbi:MAG: hypothetical protein KA144_09555 [Xanthomonadaceae bacterium]|nr:hypothetical protein [Xanthomonadaceae bacterium]